MLSENATTLFYFSQSKAPSIPDLTELSTYAVHQLVSQAPYLQISSADLLLDMKSFYKIGNLAWTYSEGDPCTDADIVLVIVDSIDGLGADPVCLDGNNGEDAV